MRTKKEQGRRSCGLWMKPSGREQVLDSLRDVLARLEALLAARE
jgi:hypothetical protein